jgi:hypothetical protein
MTSSSSTDGSTAKSRSDAPAPPPEPKPARAAAPSPELLEFLGEFGDERDGWIDPIELDEASDAPEPKR